MTESDGGGGHMVVHLKDERKGDLEKGEMAFSNGDPNMFFDILMFGILTKVSAGIDTLFHINQK